MLYRTGIVLARGLPSLLSSCTFRRPVPFEVSKLDTIGVLSVYILQLGQLVVYVPEPLTDRVLDQRVFVYSIIGGSCSAVELGADSEASSDLSA